jgi:VIT1/CCC1 family predicted Fe2+/Mn2+ transporter
LRAAILGANDGILSTAGLMVGVAAAAGGRTGVLVAGMAGLAAGAMSMAAGEYVSVSSQADTERADLARERGELEQDPVGELEELAGIYESRGLEADLAREVASQLMARDALEAHARDELGITAQLAARPVQAALASAASFAAGGVVPLGVAALAGDAVRGWLVAGASLILLIALGAVGAKLGGASPGRGALRVGGWGAVAMAMTAAIGKLFGAVV